MNALRQTFIRLSCCSLALAIAGGCSVSPDGRGDEANERAETNSAGVDDFRLSTVSVQQGEGEHVCSGSVIADQWVLTSAGCVADSHGDLRVVAGVAHLGEIETVGQVRAVDQVEIHPHFDDPRHGGDFALLHLASPLDLSGGQVAPIKLITKKEIDAVSAGSLAVAVGWSPPRLIQFPEPIEPSASTTEGSTGSGSTSGGEEPEPAPEIIAEEIVATSMELLADTEVRDVYSVALESDQIAAQPTDEGADTCLGYAGGPLMVETADGWRLAGLDSFDIGCELEGEDLPPRGYAFPANGIVGWIHGKMGPAEGVADDSCEGRCGTRAQGCRCDPLCEENGNCCADYSDHC